MLVRDRYWLAGLLEGEGCFYVAHSNGRRYTYPAIGVNMSDRDVMERAASLLGVRCRPLHPPSHRNTGRKPQWRAQVSGRRAVQLMRELQPLLGERRQGRIEEVLVECGA